MPESASECVPEWARSVAHVAPAPVGGEVARRRGLEAAVGELVDRRERGGVLCLRREAAPDQGSGREGTQ